MLIYLCEMMPFAIFMQLHYVIIICMSYSCSRKMFLSVESYLSCVQINFFLSHFRACLITLCGNPPLPSFYNMHLLIFDYVLS
jgi:hypothetical protein